MSPREHGKWFYKLADLIETHIDELAWLETLDNGKPLNNSRNIDFPLVTACYRYHAGWADKIWGKTIPITRDFGVPESGDELAFETIEKSLKI